MSPPCLDSRQIILKRLASILTSLCHNQIIFSFRLICGVIQATSTWVATLDANLCPLKNIRSAFIVSSGYFTFRAKIFYNISEKFWIVCFNLYQFLSY